MKRRHSSVSDPGTHSSPPPRPAPSLPLSLLSPTLSPAATLLGGVYAMNARTTLLGGVYAMNARTALTIVGDANVRILFVAFVHSQLLAGEKHFYTLFVLEEKKTTQQIG